MLLFIRASGPPFCLDISTVVLVTFHSFQKFSKGSRTKDGNTMSLFRPIMPRQFFSWIADCFVVVLIDEERTTKVVFAWDSWKFCIVQVVLRKKLSASRGLSLNVVIVVLEFVSSYLEKDINGTNNNNNNDFLKQSRVEGHTRQKEHQWNVLAGRTNKSSMDSYQYDCSYFWKSTWPGGRTSWFVGYRFLFHTFCWFHYPFLLSSAMVGVSRLCNSWNPIWRMKSF